ncbi:hypothetical protein Taro_033866, partial [Colocasia esculenta]|nr:hypothetical protein [Colocasia esculenta]
EARVDQGEGFPDPSLLWRSTKNPEEWCFGDFLGLPKESFNDTFDPFGDKNLTSSPLAAKISSQWPVIFPSISFNAMASRGRRGGAPACEDEPRREERAEQQDPVLQGPAHTQAALQAQLEAQEGEMEQYLEEKKASQKRPATTFQRQDKKKVVYQTQQRSVAVGSTQRPQDQGLSEISAGSPARSASPSSGSSSSASYRKTRKASSPSSSAFVAQLSLRSSILDEVIEQHKADPRLLELVGKAGIARDEDDPEIPGASKPSHWGDAPNGYQAIPSPLRASSGDPLQLEARVDQGEGFPDPSLLWRSTKNPEEWCFGDFLGLPKESFNDTFDPFGGFVRGKQELDVKSSCRQDLQSAASDLAVHILKRPDTTVKFFSAEQ